MKKICFCGVLVLFAISGCRQRQASLPAFKGSDILGIVNNMTDLMIHDITNPPLASRFFAYACIAGYEVVSQNDSTLPKLYGVLNKYPQLQRPDSIRGYSYQLSALLAILATAQKMQPSGKLLAQYEQELVDSCREKGFSEEMIGQSKKYALAISKHQVASLTLDDFAAPCQDGGARRPLADVAALLSAFFTARSPSWARRVALR